MKAMGKTRNSLQLSLGVKGMFRWREVSAEKRDVSGYTIGIFRTLPYV